MSRIAIPSGMQTACFEMAPGALAVIPEVLKEFFPGCTPWIVADENTWRAAGEKVRKILTDAGMMPHAPRIYPGSPVLHASEALAQEVKNGMPQGFVVPVAVGSGTINDVVKRAAGLCGIRYCCIPTAPSVDGFTSTGASLLADGLKKTMPCPAPYAVVADTEVLAAAPAEMAASGYADLFSKIPAGADWVMADTFGFEKISQPVWDLVQPDLRQWLRDPNDMAKIFNGLAATGYAMQLYGQSRPASAGEHLISHVWDMEGSHASHGFQVSVGTVAVTAMAEALSRLEVADLRRLAKAPTTRLEREKELDELFKKGVYGNAKEVALAKFREPAATLAFREEVYAQWDALRKNAFSRYYALSETKRMLQDAHCPTTPEEIGVSEEDHLHAIRAAQGIRNRYTLLDLAYELGLMDHVLAAVAAC